MTIIKLAKLKHQLNQDGLVEYRLGELSLNPLLGSHFKLKFSGAINCVACNRSIKKSFNNGYCYPCLQTLAECDLCIVKPELCHFDKGTCRDNEFAARHCNIDHSIYLSLTSGIKVGITRSHQEVSRWIDQGASQAIRLMKVARRKDAGLIEVKLAKELPDKTDWRKMLRNQCEEIDLVTMKREVETRLPAIITELSPECSYLAACNQEPSSITHIKYPVLAYPEKIKSHNLDKDPIVEGVLTGIKGQYLILDTGVMNMRKFAGYEVELLT